jgi:hypothetical protein
VITSDAVVKAANDRISAEVGDELVILDLISGQYFGLDGVGRSIWELIQQPRRVEDIRRALVFEYEVDQSVCEADVLAFLQSMADEGLIVVDQC